MFRKPTKHLVLLLALFSALALQAQPHLGIKAGVGWSNPQLSIGPPDAYSSTDVAGGLAGIVLGLFTQIHLHNKWLLQPAFQLVHKGYKEKHSYSFAGTTNSYIINNSVSYFELPLNLVYAFKSTGSGLQVGAGPVISFLNQGSSQSYGFSKVDAGANVFIGYQTPVGFSVQLGYTHGFADMIEYPGGITSLKNRFAALSVGYLF